MRIYVFVLIAATVGMISACTIVPRSPLVPPEPVDVNHARLVKPSVRIGVVITPIPKVNTFFPGADCLACIAAASVVNSSLTTHIRTLTVDGLRSLKPEITELLHRSGAQVIAISDDLKVRDLPRAITKGSNRAWKDFSALRDQYQIDKLLVIELDKIGVWRAYSTYVPAGDPKAIVSGKGYIVNLDDNSYEWYEGFSCERSTDGKWDEPPTFPKLTNAYYQAIEACRDVIKKPFTK